MNDKKRLVLKEHDVNNEDLQELVDSKITGIYLDTKDSDFINAFILQTDEGTFRISVGGEVGSWYQTCELLTTTT